MIAYRVVRDGESSQPTYEGLKRGLPEAMEGLRDCSQPTYEGLKHDLQRLFPALTRVPSLPMRD